MSNMNETLRQQSPLFSPWAQQPERPSALSALFSIQSLKQAALRIADIRHGGSFQTRDLVALLVSHAARNKRSMQPRTAMRMTLPVNRNRVSVRLTIES